MQKLFNRPYFDPRFPFDPSKWKLFYGWIILGAGVFGVLMSLPGQTTGISIFTDHLIENYRIDRIWLTGTYLIGTAACGFLVRYAGKIYDKSGVRPIAIAAAILLAFTLVLLSQLDRIVGGISNMLGMSYSKIILFVLLTLLFFTLRYSGQGVTTLISRAMVMKWFEARRGFANFFLGVITTLGFNATPKFFDYLIRQGNWRSAWLWAALFLIIIYIPFLIVFFRDNPQGLGMEPDGPLKAGKTKTSHSRFIAKRDFTVREARKTREFWLFTAVIALLGLFFTGFTFNFESIFESQGLTKELAMRIFIFSGLFSLFFQFVANWLSDYVSLRYYLPLAGMTIALNILVIPYIQDGNLFYYLFIICLGLNTSFFGVFTAITWPRLYGIKYLGEISGSAMGIVVSASAAGPFLMSLSFSYTTSYNLSFYFCAAIALILFIFSFTARDERKIR